MWQVYQLLRLEGNQDEPTPQEQIPIEVLGVVDIEG